MVIKQVSKGKYHVCSGEGGIPLASFTCNEEAEKFIIEQKARQSKDVENERQRLIDIADRIKNKHRSRISGKAEDRRRIKVLVKGNPKRPTSKSYKRFMLYEDGMTVSKFIKSGGTSSDVLFDSKRQYISLT